MCHDPAARPPAPPRTGEVGGAGLTTLTAADGTAFSAAWAAPADVAAAGAGVVVLPDIRGLHPYYVALTERFAEAGLPAVAIDWFGRTAGVAAGGTRDAGLDWRAHVPRTTPAGIDTDVTAAVAELRRRSRPGLPVLAVGFCLGGSHAWRLSGGALDVAACVGFYGRPALVGDAAFRASRPTLLLIAGADTVTPVEEQLALAGTMHAAGADVTTAVYDGAPHSFFDRAATEWEEACRDAWRRILELVDRVGAGTGTRATAAVTSRRR